MQLLLLLVTILLGSASLGNGAQTYTVSGISSGGAMAVQFHVAHSSIVNGAGIIAGVPYWCAGMDIINALEACMSQPELISITELEAATSYAYLMESIDSPSSLSSSKVWLYSGKKDTVVDPGVMKKVQSYYGNYIHSSNIVEVFNISSEHSFVTDNYGNKCDFLGSPYMNNCGFDSAGALLGWLLGGLNPRTTSNPQLIQTLDQKSFIPLVGPDVAAMADTAYVYVPTNCKAKTGCRIHVVFHGCEQTLTNIGKEFYMNAGYNEWAEANNILILYPQAKITDLNPKGCWDWWGYTGADYATKDAVQIATVKKMLDYISSTPL